jgi:hypothetical protein
MRWLLNRLFKLTLLEVDESRYRYHGGGGQFSSVVNQTGALVVTANAVQPGALINHVGAGLIKNITLPDPFFSGIVILVADAVFTWDATGNISVAGTSTAIGRAILFAYDPATLKWYPGYVL